MVSKAFDYRAPESVAEAVALLSSEGARVLAGGQDLLNQLRSRQVRANVLIDLRNIAELGTIARTREPSDAIRIGAMATMANVAADAAIGKYAAALREAAAGVGDAATRNFSTLGGSVSSAQPANDIVAALLALDAVVHLQDKSGTRTVSIADFVATKERSSGSELVTAVDVPIPPGRAGSAYLKFGNAANFYPLCGVAVAISRSADGKVTQARVAVTGAGPATSRRPSAEAHLVGGSGAQAALTGVIGIDECVTDLFASADYRSHLADVLAADAASLAFRRSETASN